MVSGKDRGNNGQFEVKYLLRRGNLFCRNWKSVRQREGSTDWKNSTK
jgi:hypothetical protein